MTTRTATIALGRTTYTATPSRLGYDLTGPRGGKLIAIRNVPTGALVVLDSQSRRVAVLSDASGALVRVS